MSEAPNPQVTHPNNGGVPITLACALYDRMQALYTG